MEIAAIIIAIVLGFIAFKFIAGVAKFAVLAVIVVAALYFAGAIG